MSHNKTQAEIRDAETNRELIEITEAVQAATQATVEANVQRFAVDEAATIDKKRNNFRPHKWGYDFSQMYRRTASLKKSIRRTLLI